MLNSHSNVEPTLGEEPKQCRICFDTDPPNDIISPCLCSGGSAYVHRRCLNQWRSNNIGGRGFKYCNVCQFEYVIERVLGDPKEERKRLLKYYLFMFRDITGIFLITQMIVAAFASFIQRLDTQDHHIESYFPDRMQGFLSYYCGTIIIILAIIGLIAFIILLCSSGNGRSSGGSSSTSNFSGSSGVGIIVMCAIFGLIVGIGLSVMGIKKLMEHHSSRLWLRQEAEKYEVKDFQGRRSELISPH